jgi:hypothetical protein
MQVVCVALPAIIATAVAAASPLFWKGGSLTLSEAAALRDAGEVARQIASGADPNAAYPLRPGVLAASSLTPLEAAVGSRRAEIVDVLLTHGATVNAGGWRRLHCFAVRTGASDVVSMLDRYKPADAPSSCEGVSTPF